MGATKGVTRLALARLLALATPLALLGGALGSQYLGGLYPCEMCHWQRWPHYAALPLAAFAIVLRGRPAERALLYLAALAIFAAARSACSTPGSNMAGGRA